LANVGEYYTQTTWQAGVTPLSEAALNNIDAGFSGIQTSGVLQNGTNIGENKTLASGYNFFLISPITIDSTKTLTVNGKLKLI